ASPGDLLRRPADAGPGEGLAVTVGEDDVGRVVVAVGGAVACHGDVRLGGDLHAPGRVEDVAGLRGVGHQVAPGPDVVREQVGDVVVEGVVVARPLVADVEADGEVEVGLVGRSAGADPRLADPRL